MRRDYEPEASRLRRDGKLWPQTLTDDELEQQLGSTDASTQPISARMLREELARRRGTR